MSKIEDLIKQYCPNGVEYKELGDVCQIEKGQQLNKNSLKNGGEFPVMNGGISPSGYWNEYNTGSNTIIISQGGASAGYTQFMTVKFWAGAHCYTVKPKEIFNKYLYYFIKNNQNILMSNQYGAGIPALNKRTLETLRIPVPPMPVQEEIVRVLDAFTALEAELEAELEARKRQYEYYRNKLLTFDENTTEGRRIKFMQLGEVCRKVSTIKWKDNQNKEYKYIDLSSLNRNNNTIEETMIITNDNAPNRAQQIVKKDDVLLGTTRPTLRRYCIIPNEYDNQICSTGYCVLRADTNIIIPKYLCFSST